ncbi:hypothetical protein [Aeromicrobium sp.]|uniref:hypothetical protein n=1 Tax=Aeromicrobium sp. TaxID=1871063 RepID=UPI003D6A7E8A
MQTQLARRLTIALGIVYAVMGSFEVIMKWGGPDYGAMAFLGGTLLISAALIIGGLFAQVPEKYRLAMIIVGSVAGVVATVWTVVVPILAIAVVVLSARGDGGTAVSTPD